MPINNPYFFKDWIWSYESFIWELFRSRR